MFLSSWPFQDFYNFRNICYRVWLAWEAVLDEWLLWFNMAKFMFMPLLSLSHFSKWVDMCSMIHITYYARILQCQILQCWTDAELTRFSWNEGQNADDSQQSGQAVFTEREVKLPLILKFISKKWHCIKAFHRIKARIFFKIIPNSLLNASISILIWGTMCYKIWIQGSFFWFFSHKGILTHASGKLPLCKFTFSSCRYAWWSCSSNCS